MIPRSTLLYWLQAIAKNVCEIYDQPLPRIKWNKKLGKNTHGQYSFHDNVVELNPKVPHTNRSLVYEVLDTLCHELAHAFFDRQTAGTITAKMNRVQNLTHSTGWHMWYERISNTATNIVVEIIFFGESAHKTTRRKR